MADLKKDLDKDLDKENTTEEAIADTEETAADETAEAACGTAGDTGTESAEAEDTKEAAKETGESARTEDAEEAEGSEGMDESEEIGMPEETEASEDTGESADSADKPEKESIFGRKKKNKKDPKDEKIEELTDKYTRLMAEFENFRKRTEKEKSQMWEMGAKNIIESILPVVDSFEHGLKTIPEEDKESAVAVGMDKIYKQLMAVLEKAGVTAIEAEGKEFDPNLHNAMMSVEDESGIGSNMVAQELQKGYMYRDQVVRHSMVSVTS